MAVEEICYLAAFALSLASLGLCAWSGAETVYRPSNLQRLTGAVVAVVALTLALAPPLDDLGDRFFYAHMIEHELFLYTIPVTLLAVRPVPLAMINFRRLPSTWRRSVGQAARHPWFLRALSRLGHPIPALILSTVALWAWHAPYLYDLALGSEWIHDLEHVSFLATALFYWRPLLESGRHTPALDSNAKRALYLISGGMQGGILGALIALSDHVVYTGYLTAPGASAATVLSDQRLGGAIMWFSGAVFCGAMAAVVMRERPAARTIALRGEG